MAQVQLFKEAHAPQDALKNAFMAKKCFNGLSIIGFLTDGAATRICAEVQRSSETGICQVYDVAVVCGQIKMGSATKERESAYNTLRKNIGLGNQGGLNASIQRNRRAEFFLIIHAWVTETINRLFHLCQLQNYLKTRTKSKSSLWSSSNEESAKPGQISGPLLVQGYKIRLMAKTLALRKT